MLIELSLCAHIHLKPSRNLVFGKFAAEFIIA